MTRREWLWIWAALIVAVVATLFSNPGPAHADPYCGPGMNYDYRHGVCQAGAPVPGGQGVYPYPLPGQQGPGGYGPPSYGGN